MECDNGTMNRKDGVNSNRVQQIENSQRSCTSDQMGKGGRNKKGRTYFPIYWKRKKEITGWKPT